MGPPPLEWDDEENEEVISPDCCCLLPWAGGIAEKELGDPKNEFEVEVEVWGDSKLLWRSSIIDPLPPLLVKPLFMLGIPPILIPISDILEWLLMNGSSNMDLPFPVAPLPNPNPLPIPIPFISFLNMSSNNSKGLLNPKPALLVFADLAFCLALLAESAADSQVKLNGPWGEEPKNWERSSGEEAVDLVLA